MKINNSRDQDIYENKINDGFNIDFKKTLGNKYKNNNNLNNDNISTKYNLNNDYSNDIISRNQDFRQKYNKKDDYNNLLNNYDKDNKNSSNNGKINKLNNNLDLLQDKIIQSKNNYQNKQNLSKEYFIENQDPDSSRNPAYHNKRENRNIDNENDEQNNKNNLSQQNNKFKKLADEHYSNYRYNYKNENFSDSQTTFHKQNKQNENMNQNNYERHGKALLRDEIRERKDFTNSEINLSNSNDNNHIIKNVDKFSNFNSRNRENNSTYNNESRNNFYVKNNSSPKINKLSNYEIGNIPEEITKSPSSKKTLKRSQLYESKNGFRNNYEKKEDYYSPKSSLYNTSGKNFNSSHIPNNDSQTDFYKKDITPKKRNFNDTNFENLIDTNSKSLQKLSLSSQNRENRVNDKIKSPVRNENIYKIENLNPSRSPINKHEDNNNTYYSPNRNNFSHPNGFYKPSLINNDNYKNSNEDFKNLNNLSMFSQKTEMKNIKSQNLAKYLYELVIVDSITESHKECLSLRTDVSLRAIFDFFDYNKRNCISLNDFQEILKDLEIHIPLPDLKLTFKRFDNDMDGRLE